MPCWMTTTASTIGADISRAGSAMHGRVMCGTRSCLKEAHADDLFAGLAGSTPTSSWPLSPLKRHERLLGTIDVGLGAKPPEECKTGLPPLSRLCGVSLVRCH